MGVSVSELTGKSVFLSVPCYACQLSSNLAVRLLEFASLCRAYDVGLTFNFLSDSLVTRVRNRCSDMFLASDCSHHCLIDSDVEFNPGDLLRLLSLDKEFIAAPYPKKQINWRRIKDVCLKHPDFDPAHLDKMGGDYVINLVKVPNEGNTTLNVTELNSITDAGTGFMLLKRSVYEKLIAAGEAKSYVPMQDEPSFYGPEIFDFFKAEVDSETRNYLSEDYSFCRSFKRIGGEIWLAPWVNLTHWGLYGFRGSMQAIAETGVAM